jgi:hypothetical protein
MSIRSYFACAGLLALIAASAGGAGGNSVGGWQPV